MIKKVVKTTPSTRPDISRPIQIGESTHHHDHVMTPTSFSTIKTITNIRPMSLVMLNDDVAVLMNDSPV